MTAHAHPPMPHKLTNPTSVRLEGGREPRKTVHPSQVPFTGVWDWLSLNASLLCLQSRLFQVFAIRTKVASIDL